MSIDDPESPQPESVRDGKGQVETERGPLGDARPDAQQDDPRANPAQRPEKVENRPMVSKVTPEDYPASDRADSDPTGSR